MADMDDDKEFYEEGAALAARYEAMVRNHDRNTYFDSDEMETLIDYYIATDKLDKAEEAQAYGAAIHPDSRAIKLRLAKIHLLKERYPEADKILRSLDSIEGDYIGIWAECIARKGEIDRSKELFRKYLQDCHPDEISTVYMDIATFYNTIGQYAAAAEFLDEACQLYPDSTELWNERGYSYDLCGNDISALESYNRAIDIDPYKSESWCYLGSVYFKTQNMEKALEAFNFALAINGDDMLTVLQKAHCLFNLSRYEEAKEAYRQYLEYNKSDALALSFYAECYENTDDYNTAIELYKKAVKLDPMLADGWAGLCACSFEMDERQAEALNYAEEAYLLHPDNVEIVSHLADNYDRRAALNDSNEDYDRALRLYLRCMELEPQNDRHWMQAGNIYFRFSLYEKARHFYEIAYTLNPAGEKLTVMLAMTCYCLDDRKAFMKYYKEACGTYPNARNIIIGIFPDAAKWIDSATDMTVTGSQE